jgi:hypothetical protein
VSRRGRADASGTAELTDALVVLGSLFLGAGPLERLDAADADDSGDLDLSDPVYLLRYLFVGGAPLPAPGSEACGRDATPDGLERRALPRP